MEQIVASWLTRFGTPALFALLMLGVFGLPVPDETVLVLAGVLMGRGQLRPLPTVIGAIGGAITGITVSYAAGRFAGMPLLLRYGAAIHIDRSLMIRVSEWFGRLGKWLLTIGYFVPGVRHLTAFVAGASMLPVWTFSVFAYSGAILWVSSFLGIGYVLGDNWHGFVSDLHRHGAAILGIALAAGFGYAMWMRQKSGGR
jgi:membrane protein DedA with SNARE-associated domain